MNARALLALLLLAVLAGSASAQANPPFTLAPTPSWIILSSFSSVPNNGGDIPQVFHVKLSNNQPGEWTTAMSAEKLPAFFGGDGLSHSILMGKFNPYRGTFLYNTEANALNTSADELHCTLSVDGLWAVVERPGGVWLGSRAAVGTPFGVPVQVTGLASSTRYYPAIGTVNGDQKILYSDGQDIVMQDFDLATATASGTPVVICQPVQAGAIAISPSPVFGKDGDIEALWLSEEVVPKTGPHTGDADPVWAADLDPSTPARVQVDTTDWQCCGGVAGGFLYFSHDILPRWHLMHSEAAFLLGDAEPVGGVIDLTAMGKYEQAGSSNPLIATMLLGAATIAPFSFPPLAGQIGLDPSFLLQIGQVSTTNQDGIVSLSFPLPTTPSLSGVKLPVQALLSNLAAGTHVFTSTAWIEVL